MIGDAGPSRSSDNGINTPLKRVDDALYRAKRDTAQPGATSAGQVAEIR